MWNFFRIETLRQHLKITSCRGAWGDVLAQRPLRRFSQWLWIDHSILWMRTRRSIPY